MRPGGRPGVAIALLAASLFLVAALAVPIGGGLPRLASALPSAAVIARGGAPTATPSPTLPVASRPEVSLPPSPTPLPETGIEVGQLAPDFELRTLEGDPFRLSDLRGRPVWINFWAPWCPACRTEMPRLEVLYREHRDDGLVILGVGVRDSPQTMRTYAREVAVSYPIVVDGDGAVANRYQALALPVHYWIDRHGVVRDWAFGELPPDLLAASVESILGPSPLQAP